MVGTTSTTPSRRQISSIAGTNSSSRHGGTRNRSSAIWKAEDAAEQSVATIR